MAVHRRSYRTYAGALTPGWRRLLVLPRYALRGVFDSRQLLAFFVFCCSPFVVEVGLIYLVNNPAAQVLLNVGGPLLAIDNVFFYRILAFQGNLALVLAALVGPLMVAPDLSNGALALYLSRPLSRFAYVLGKMSALLLLLSLITWVPGLLLFALQAGLAGGGWGLRHLSIAGATLAASLLWIGLLSFAVVALSAWVRLRVAATALLPGLILAGGAAAQAWNRALDTPWGRLADVNALVNVVWRGLFGLPPRGAVFPWDRDVPAWAAWGVLLALCGVCLYLLDRRLRAREVVR